MVNKRELCNYLLDVMNIEQQLNALFRAQDDKWTRYQALLPETNDVTLIVLKGHLIVEEMLGVIAAEHCPYVEHLEAARLSFSQLSHVVRAMLVLPLLDNGWEAISVLNTLRNKLAHNLEPEGIDRYIEMLDKLCQSDERTPPNYKPPNTPAEKAKAAVCFIVGQLSVVTAISAFFERNKRVHLGDDVQPSVPPDVPASAASPLQPGRGIT